MDVGNTHRITLKMPVSRVSVAIAIGSAAISADLALALVSGDSNAHFASPAIVLAAAIGVVLRCYTDLPLKTIFGVAVVVAFARHTLTDAILTGILKYGDALLGDGWHGSAYMEMMIGNLAFSVPIIFILWAFCGENVKYSHFLVWSLAFVLAAPIEELLLRTLAANAVFAHPSVAGFYTIQLARRLLLVVMLTASLRKSANKERNGEN